MEEDFQIEVFTPHGPAERDSFYTDYLIKIHQAEKELLRDLVANTEIDEEASKLTEKFVYKTLDLLPESKEEIEEKIKKHETVFTDLRNAHQECPNLSFRISRQIIEHFDDASSVDNEFIYTGKLTLSKERKAMYESSKIYNKLGIILFYKHIYYGHVWYFTKPSMPEYTGIYGMKASLVNILIKNCGKTEQHRTGIATRLIKDGVFVQARKEERKFVIVPWPLEPMIPILQKLGFEEINTFDMTEERQFLSPMAGTSNYFKVSL